MGTVFKKTATKPLPAGVELFTKNGERLARWKPSKGKTRTAPVTTGRDGTDRIVVTVGTYIAKFRDRSGLVCEISTGCRDEDAARSILSKLERRAELVKSEVISTVEAATADHQRTPIAEHFAAYLNHVRAKGATVDHIADLKRKSERLFADCFATLRDIAAEKVESWLNDRQAEGMSARTRNAYPQTVRGFCKWCVHTDRLASNPLVRIARADEKCDRRRRSMTEAELVTLLRVATMRPLAEFGRESVSVDDDETEGNGKRSKWTKTTLTLDTLNAADEKNRQGSTIPLRADLANDL